VPGEGVAGKKIMLLTVPPEHGKQELGRISAGVTPHRLGMPGTGTNHATQGP
jgi:hypothetical protein